MSAPAIAQPPGHFERWLLVGGVLLALGVSFVVASDRLTWFLEVIWAMVGLALIAGKWQRRPKMVSMGPPSTWRPLCITDTVSEICRTTARSCETNR